MSSYTHLAWGTGAGAGVWLENTPGRQVHLGHKTVGANAVLSLWLGSMYPLQSTAHVSGLNVRGQ